MKEREKYFLSFSYNFLISGQTLFYYGQKFKEIIKKMKEITKKSWNFLSLVLLLRKETKEEQFQDSWFTMAWET